MPHLTNRIYLLWLNTCVLENLWQDTDTLITVAASGEGNGLARGEGRERKPHHAPHSTSCVLYHVHALYHYTAKLVQLNMCVYEQNNLLSNGFRISFLAKI